MLSALKKPRVSPLLKRLDNKSGVCVSDTDIENSSSTPAASCEPNFPISSSTPANTVSLLPSIASFIDTELSAVQDSSYKLKPGVDFILYGPQLSLTPPTRTGFSQSLRRNPLQDLVSTQTEKTVYQTHEASVLHESNMNTEVTNNDSLSQFALGNNNGENVVTLDPKQFQALFADAMNSESTNNVIKSVVAEQFQGLSEQVNLIGNKDLSRRARLENIDVSLEKLPNLALLD